MENMRTEIYTYFEQVSFNFHQSLLFNYLSLILLSKG